MTALDDSYLDEPPRELCDACERCGDEAHTTLTADGELCGPCRDELAGEVEQIAALCAAGDGVEAESSEQLREAAAE